MINPDTANAPDNRKAASGEIFVQTRPKIADVGTDGSSES
jgi:hypothetical protein